MGYVVGAAAQTTAFVIFDTRYLAAPAEAGVAIPHRIPSGFHGNWIADAAKHGLRLARLIGSGWRRAADGG